MNQIKQKKTFTDEEDEPYSPGGSDTEADILPSIRQQPIITKPSDELQKQMDEINRQIEAEKMNIAGMLTDNVIYTQFNQIVIETNFKKNVFLR